MTFFKNLVRMKTIVLLSFLIVFSFAYPQKKSGVAIYKVIAIQDNNKKDDFSMLKDQASNMYEFISYNLYFSPKASLFSLDEKMKTNGIDRQQELALIMAGKGKYYIQNGKDSLLYQTESQGDLFLITESANNTVWKITSEKKSISGFETIKAIGHHTPYGHQTGYEVVAWFAPKLSFPFGPREFSGLPGLILELEEKAYGNIYYCTEISFDKTFDIQKPTNGIRMNEKEFNSYSQKKADEFFKSIGN